MKFIKRVFRFISKLFAYVPLLWKDEDYDYGHILSLLRYKLKRVRLHILKHDIIVEAAEVAAKIAYAELLIQRYLDDDFFPELQKAHDDKWGEDIWLAKPDALYCRKNVTIKELDEQELKEQREIYRLQDQERERVWKEIWTHLNDTMREYWD